MKTIFFFVLGTVIFYIGFYFWYDSITILQRIVSPLALIILFFGWLLQNIINGLAIYLRAFKEEPLYLASMINSIYTIIVTLFLVSNANYEFIFCGFLTGNILMLPYVCFLYRKKVSLHGDCI